MNRLLGRGRATGVMNQRKREKITWLWIVFWLIFLAEPVLSNIADGGRHTVGALMLVAGGGVYAPAITFSMRRLWAGQPRTSVGEAVAGVSSLVVALFMLAAAPLIGMDAFALLPYSVVILTMGLSRTLGAAFAFALIGATASLSRSLTGHNIESGLVLAAAASGIAAGLGAFSAERNRDAEAAREDAALLRLQDERNRMARDLHDILGHSLTVITMKAELAGKLIDVDPAKAKEQIADLEKLSRGALADVRQTVSGYREMSLAGELARSRRALTDAGIRVDMPGSVDEVAPDLRDLFAWAVREATTNIIRHSGASTCTITLDPTKITVMDDGRGANGGATSGNGLAGLQERAAAHGAHVTTSSEAGFALTVEALPASQEPSGSEGASPARSSRLALPLWGSRAGAETSESTAPAQPALPEEN